MSSSKSEITIAIAGGGIGGVAAAIALGKAGYKVHIFEQAPEFSELGLGIGLGGNTLRALELLGVLGSLAGAAVEIRPPGAKWAHYVSWQDGSEVADVRFEGSSALMHRKRALEALVTRLPANVTSHFSARVVDVVNMPATPERGAHVQLKIATSRRDGLAEAAVLETFDADALIGADGIKSAIREKIIPGARVRWTGTYAYRHLVPMASAQEALGDIGSEVRIWIGPHRHVVMFPVENGKFVNIAANVGVQPKAGEDLTWDGPWIRQGDRDTVLQQFEGWDKRLLGLLKAVEKPEQWAMFDLLPLSNWTNGSTTLLGDSAHASVPYNGAGAGQAIEDAYVLGTLLALPECTRETLPVFLKAYEEARRPRASQQQQHALRTADVYNFTGELGSDYGLIEKDLNMRFRWIWDHDLEKDVEDAKAKLREAAVIG